MSTGHHSVSNNAGCDNLRKRRAFTLVGTGQGGGMNRQTGENLEFRLPVMCGTYFYDINIIPSSYLSMRVLL